MHTFISRLTKCVAFALANHKLGGSAELDMIHAVSFYAKQKRHPFQCIKKYNLLNEEKYFHKK